jgi:hypothetical protein
MCFLEETLDNNEVDSEWRIQNSLLGEYSFETSYVKQGAVRKSIHCQLMKVGWKVLPPAEWKVKEGRYLSEPKKKCTSNLCSSLSYIISSNSNTKHFFSAFLIYWPPWPLSQKLAYIDTFIPYTACIWHWMSMGGILSAVMNLIIACCLNCSSLQPSSMTGTKLHLWTAVGSRLCVVEGRYHVTIWNSFYLVWQEAKLCSILYTAYCTCKIKVHLNFIVGPIV